MVDSLIQIVNDISKTLKNIIPRVLCFITESLPHPGEIGRLLFLWVGEGTHRSNHDRPAAGFTLLLPSSLWWWILLPQHVLAVQHWQPWPSCPWLQAGCQDKTGIWALHGEVLKKNPQLACCGRENRKPAESQSFAKGAGERWQGELSALSSCIICFYYLGDGTFVGKYSLEMPTPSVSWGTQPVYSRLARKSEENVPPASPRQGAETRRNSFITLQWQMYTSEGGMTTPILDITSLDIPSLMASFSLHKMKSPFCIRQLSGPGPA